MFRDDLAAVLRDARFRANLSRPALAAISGVSEDTILNIEKETSAPRGQTVYALAEALKLNVEDLLSPEPTAEAAQ